MPRHANVKISNLWLKRYGMQIYLQMYYILVEQNYDINIIQGNIN